MENNLKGKVKNIGIIWEGEDWGGVDTYLYNLINTKTFNEIDVVIFTNKNNLGAKRLFKNLKGKKVGLVYFNSLNSFAPHNIFFKILLNLLKPLFFLVSIFQFYFLLRNYKFEVFMGQCGGYGDFRSEMASIFIAKFLGFPVRSLVICHACIKPIFWHDKIEAEAWISHIGNKSFQLMYIIYKNKETISAKARTVQVYYDYTNKCSIPIPDRVRNLLAEKLVK